MDENGRKQCVVCEREGLKGITLRGKLICEVCERDIVNSSVWTARYDFFRGRLRQVWDNPES